MLAAPDRSAHRLVSVRRHGVERTLVVLGHEDRLAYLRLAATAAPGVEAGLTDRVVANRVASCSLDPPAFTLRPWRLERRAFADALRELARTHRTLVFADVADCYASIGPRLVRTSLEAIGAPGGREVEVFLARFGRTGVLGLPVGPEPSALFANAVLAHVDRALVAEGIAHLRWVDDLVLGIRGPKEATEGLRVIRSALRQLGLRPNERKTRVVVDPGVLVAAPSRLRGRAVRVG
jgi:hypothetical protein